jgi:SPP1 gp7 family putative phage head morphogenesis protein
MWLTQILDATARDVGRTLAVQTARGASRDDMAAAVRGVLLAADGRTVRTLTDLLTSRSMSRGALDLYAAEGVDEIDFVTAGDSRVCSTCDDLEGDSPFTAADCPAPGIHGSCRCVLVPHAAGLSDTTVGAYLEGGF